MANNTIGWGQGATNNNIGWGRGSTNDIGWGSVYENSYVGDTDLVGVTYLLDQYPGAAGAYSLRNLSSSTTDVVRVRRSSDNTEQDFSYLEIMDGTLATFCSATDGYVVTWYDQSGNGNDATQSTAANQPQIVASGVVITENGMPIIKSVNNAYLDINATLNDLSAITQFSVSKINQAYSIMCSYYSTANNYVLAAASALLDATNALSPTSSSLNGSTYVFTTRNDTFNALQNQTLVSMYWSSPTFNLFTKLGHVTTSYLMYSMQEFIIYNNDASSNISNIEDNINGYYSIY